jgi:hypothetical protein
VRLRVLGGRESEATKNTKVHEGKKLKTLKISVVATVALTLAWWLQVPQRIWPRHPIMADLVMGLVLCLVLQVLWDEPKAAVKK